jgi:uncharacterized protein YlxW (UPF0749 family)
MSYEKLGAFYLGKQYDLVKKKLLDQLLMYDARDLTTHAVCVGMTGSGKTGLCIDLLEEAALDNVPTIIIDPKGDMTNMLLTFPELKSQDFRNWINLDDARRKGMSEDAFATQQSELWRKGLADWGQSGERIRLLRNSGDFVIYTPGSDAGIPVSILQSFAAPRLSWDDDAELLRERIEGSVSALLGLVGIEADPVQSREHILLSNIFEYFWRRNEDLDLRKLILAVQKPPMRQLGVFNVDTFFPENDRFKLAMKMNNIIASPGFQSWLQGQPMDVSSFLSTPKGKPRHSIFYIAHLNDAERMFFVTMLLNQVITWMRTQPGTTSLRALVYMDEIFGFFPPIANPPSKQPMLTLLKQARAFGVGIVLTTQNPADLDYKGLSNAGTWFIGRLQTERDKMRVLEGLESASLQAGQSLDRGKLSNIISTLGNRVFLLHNVHEEAPVMFQTRWAMSYLRGPLTRVQIRELMGDRKPDQLTTTPAEGTMLKPAQTTVYQPTERSTALDIGFGAQPPPISSQIQQVFLPLKRNSSTAALDLETREGYAIKMQSSHLLYVPASLGMGVIHFVDRKKNVKEQQNFALLAHVPENISVLTWKQAQPMDLTERDLLNKSEPEAYFNQLPGAIDEPKEFNKLKNDLVNHLYRNTSLTLFYSPTLKTYSKPKESERDFRTRLQQEAREKRDKEIDDITDKYEKKLNNLQDRLRKYEAKLEQHEVDASAYKQNTIANIGETMLGFFMGRRPRIKSTSQTKKRRATKAKLKVEETKEDIKDLQTEIKELETELQKEVTTIKNRWEETLEKFKEIKVIPRKTDIQVDLVALAWVPYWKLTYEGKGSAKRTELMAAY